MIRLLVLMLIAAIMCLIAVKSYGFDTTIGKPYSDKSWANYKQRIVILVK